MITNITVTKIDLERKFKRDAMTNKYKDVDYIIVYKDYDMESKKNEELTNYLLKLNKEFSKDYISLKIYKIDFRLFDFDKIVNDLYHMDIRVVNGKTKHTQLGHITSQSGINVCGYEFNDTEIVVQIQNKKDKLFSGYKNYKLYTNKKNVEYFNLKGKWIYLKY